MRKQILLLSIGCLLAFQIGYTQEAKLKRAGQLMELALYQEAIPLYQKILKKNPENYEAKVSLATAFRKLRNFSKAEQWYAQLVALPECAPENFYYYGLVLLRNGKCKPAQVIFNRFLALKPDDYRRALLMDACEYQKKLLVQNAYKFRVQHLPFNSERNAFGAAFYRQGLIFASDRLEESRSDQPFLDLFFVSSIKSAFDPTDSLPAPVSFSGELNTRLHEAVVTFNPDQSEIYLTRSREIAAKKKRNVIIPLEISYAQDLGGGHWSELQSLPFNSDFYSVAHPALSPDGTTLFFASDMPGGLGGKDLYFSAWVDGQWSDPQNMGPEINSSGDDLFPYFSSDGRFYFASDGHFGLGGLDIYSLEWAFGIPKGELVNLGHPINSAADDFGLIYDYSRNVGFFTSNRPGGSGGDDLYCFRRETRSWELMVADAVTGEMITGVTVENQCPELATIDSMGGHWMLEVRADSCCEFIISKEFFLSRAVELCAQGTFDQVQEATLVTIEPEPRLRLRGQVVDVISNLPLADALISLESEECPGLLESRTDSLGRFELRLTPGCCFSLRVEKTGYFSHALNQLICRTFTRQEDNPELTFQLEPYRMTADKHPPQELPAEWGSSFSYSVKQSEEDSSMAFLLDINYENGRASLRTEALAELNRFLKLLTDNPDLIIEIGSHTDSRGNDLFNRRLSQKRAEEVVSWLIEHGIDQDRLLARGYGEALLTNRCSNGVKCSEREHSLNRRTEFRVIGEQRRYER